MPPKKTRRKRRKAQVGGSVLDTILNSGYLPELHYRGFDSGFKPYNFAGPGTKLTKRLDEHKRPLPHSKPRNLVDMTAYLHDLGYEMHKDNATRKILDNVMIADLDAIRRDKNLGWKQRADAGIVGVAMKTKRMLGLGKPVLKF
jgi:hypothetical protein